MLQPAPTQLLDALLKSIRDLPPAQIVKAEAALAAARRRVEAVVEIDAVGKERACPHCGSVDRCSWGSTRTGAHRWRCKGCRRTWTGRTGTPLANLHRPGLFIEAVRNMLDPGDTPLSGIIETDETFQRESRKGSREWVRHARNPSIYPQPPRRRWHEYGRKGPPQSIVRSWLRPILGVVDRNGQASFQHIADNKQPTIEAVLVPQIAPDAMVLFDGAPQYEAIARARGISYKVLVSGRGSKSTPKAYHLNTVNSLHAQWKNDFRPLWRGPASKYLDS